MYQRFILQISSLRTKTIYCWIYIAALHDYLDEMLTEWITKATLLKKVKKKWNIRFFAKSQPDYHNYFRRFLYLFCVSSWRYTRVPTIDAYTAVPLDTGKDAKGPIWIKRTWYTAFLVGLLVQMAFMVCLQYNFLCF